MPIQPSKAIRRLIFSLTVVFVSSCVLAVFSFTMMLFEVGDPATSFYLALGTLILVILSGISLPALILPYMRAEKRWVDKFNRLRATLPQIDAKDVSPNLLDSVDVEILNVIKQTGGNFMDLIDRLSGLPLFYDTNDLLSRLSKLSLLGYLHFDKDVRNVVLSAQGLDILNMPAIIFRTRQMPQEIADALISIRVSLQRANSTDVVVKCAQVCELILGRKIESELKTDPTRKESYAEKETRPPSKLPLGEMISLLCRWRVLREDAVVYSVVSGVNQYRRKVHIEAKESARVSEITPEDAYICNTLLEIFLRLWFA